MASKSASSRPHALARIPLFKARSLQARYLLADESLAQLRMRKDGNEIAAIRKAVDIAQKALLATMPSISAGATEKQIAAELTIQLLRAGSEPELPFAPIVSGGPNSANPHASPSDRPLQPGDLLVIDWVRFTTAMFRPDAPCHRSGR
jgi:Xaa-Pro dipeptidase